MLRIAAGGLSLGGLCAAALVYGPEDLSFGLAQAAASALRLLPAETAHHTAIAAARLGLVPHQRRPDPPVLATSVLGLQLRNPLGLAAGFDKDAEALAGLLAMGFGFVEAGSVTPQPQPGNPTPRVFRLTADRAVINRYGFNSAGMAAAEGRLRLFRQRQAADAPAQTAVGINLGKNKEQQHAVVDYNNGLFTLGPLADYVVVNISSPNTPGLRGLQGRQQLHDLLTSVKASRDALPSTAGGRPPPLLVKIAPDLSQSQLEDICEVVQQVGIDGMVVTNTTVARPSTLLSQHKNEVGGLSGAPLFDSSTRVLANCYRLTGGKVPMIGVGGIWSGQDAYDKIRAGASLVQIYTALTLEGPAVVPRIKAELAALLQRDGYTSVAQAVGTSAQQYPPLD